MFVGKLESSITQLPFDYYYLNFCKPNKAISISENLGVSLSGNLVESTPYRIYMQIRENCNRLCKTTNSKSDIKALEWIIENKYKATWFLDSLPSGYRISLEDKQINIEIFQSGVPLGFTINGKKYIYNHHHIIVKVNKHINQDTWRVVGFVIQPLSLNSTSLSVCHKFNWEEIITTQAAYQQVILTAENDFNIVEKLNSLIPLQAITREIEYSYSISFEESYLKWTSRWDVYLYTQKTEIHWISIISSFGMVFLLSAMVAHLFRRILNNEINYYNETIDSDDSGWKQVRGDIFRPPVHPNFFCIIIGSGTQLILMIVLTLIFACIGFFSPDHRGFLLTITLFLFAFMGSFGGYISARLYKLFGGIHWKTNSLSLSLLFPGFCFGIFFVINFMIWEEESSGAVDFFSLIELLFIWFGISVPLIFIGSTLGYRKEALASPCKISKIPKPITLSNEWWINFVCFIAGCLPFGCMFIELNYVMKSLWNHTTFYYLFGFLFLCFIILMITSAEVSILMTYVFMCRGDYRWWWVSICVSGSSGIFFFIYSTLYYFFQLNISRFSSTVLYFGYMLIGSVIYMLITGTIGFLATFIFLRKIFSLVKSE